MSDNKEKKLIVVKRFKQHGGGHHGGAWKIAYADFVTAMMAFFLLMWLLNSLDKDKLKGISDYFQTPITGIGKGGPGISEKMRVVDVGGGDKKTTKPGEAAFSKDNVTQKVIDEKKTLAEIEKKEQQSLEQLKNTLEAAVDANDRLKKMKNQLLMEITPEGLRIQIVDEENRPMFDVGETQLKKYTQQLLRMIGKTLNSVPNKVIISGHTDSLAYHSNENIFSNWELSTERANAARRELITGGMLENKVLRVIGASSMVLLDNKNPNAPKNRRISILVLDKKQEETYGSS